MSLYAPLLRFSGVAFAVALYSCSPTDVIEARFSSQAIEAVTREVRVFGFGIDPPACADLDPRGLPPGDAEERTGLSADAKFVGRPEDEVLAELDGLHAGRTTVVIEAWGPPCAEVGGSAEAPVCTRLASGGDPVLRGYWCNAIDRGRNDRVDLIADLETFSLIGSSLSVPTAFPANATHYDEEHPLFVAGGLPGSDRFVVQVLNHLAEAIDRVPVRFSVTEGAGALLGAQPILTEDGLAAATLQAESTAPEIAGGRVVVTAHAAGYDGSPVRFVARALPSVRAQIEVVPLSRNLVELDATDSDDHPFLLDDLDGDGLLDVATISGGASHRLVLGYGKGDGSHAIHVSEPLPGQVRAMASAHLAPGAKSLLLSVTDGALRQNVDGVGETYVIQNPRLEVHPAGEPNGERFTATPDVLSTEDGAPMTKAAIAIHARDIDRDGIDEIALSRCSYVFAVNSSQYSKVECIARLSDHTDSELALLRATPGAPPSVSVAATILSEGNDGGFRDVRLIDLDGDGSLDLVSAASSTAIGVCGQAGLRERGFGFNDNPRFFSTITFGQGWSLASGRFNDDDFADLLVTGAVRSSSPDAGLQVVAGGPCGLDIGTEPVIVGPKTGARYLVVRSEDFNHDGWSDAVLLHRNTRELQIYLGGGAYGLAHGPVLRLPFGTVSEMDLAPDGARTMVAFAAPSDNALVFVSME